MISLLPVVRKDWRGFFVPAAEASTMPPQVTPAVMATPKKDKVAVFFDYENVHRTGHGLYAPRGIEHHETVFNPIHLAEQVCAKRCNPSQLVNIRVYRGRPVPAHQPIPASAFDIQATAWQEDYRFILKTRDLKYDWPDPKSTKFSAQEKGIDVSLAVDLVEAAMTSAYDAMIVFSCDTDLLPAIELVKKIHKVHLEIACWNKANPLWLRDGLKQQPPKHLPYCHFMQQEDFESTRETVARIY